MSRELLPGSAGKRCPPAMRGWCSGFCCGRRCPVWGSCPGWTSTAGCFCRWTIPFGKGRIAPLNGLCEAVCPPSGQGKVPVPSGFPDGFGPLRRENGDPGKAQRSGFAAEEEEQRNERVFALWAEMRDMELVTTRSRRSPDAVVRQGRLQPPACGRFSGSGADSFSLAPKETLTRILEKKPPNPAV